MILQYLERAFRNNRKDTGLRALSQFVKKSKKKGNVSTWDIRLKGTELDPTNPDGIEYNKPVRFLTSKETDKYIYNMSKRRKPTKVSNRKNFRIVDYTERKNRI
tara:strand:+ start:621 stop:932 length:312 start_codon:yes stop_codon:yes gene_type:complete